MKLHSEPEKRGRARSIGGRLILLAGIVCVTFLCLLSGPIYARYMTTRTFSVGFWLVSKPSVTVIETTEAPAEGGTIARRFEVCGAATTTDSAFRFRLYGYGQEEQALQLMINRRIYTFEARALNSSTGPATQLGAKWVYVVTNSSGEEILFDIDAEMFVIVVMADTDISQLTVCAEAVRI